MTSFSARARWFFVCLFVLAGTPIVRLGAQQPATQIPPPTIRVSTRLVLVDAVVTDKKGQPVTGLKPAAFVIEERGKAQKIAFFTPAGDAGSQATPVQLAPGIYSNKPEYRSPGGPLAVLLLDAVNTPFKDQAYARLQMLKYVEQQYKPGQRMAVFALTNGLRMLQDFTSDPQVLHTALQMYQPREQITNAASPPISAGAGELRPAADAQLAAVTQELRGFQDAQVSYEMERRVQVTLAGLRSLTRVLEGLSGRKNVVWVTEAFPFTLIPEERAISQAEMADAIPSSRATNIGTRGAGLTAAAQRQEHAPEIREAAAQLASAQVAIYPVDARGLVSGAEANSDNTASRQLDSFGHSAILQVSDITNSQETMKELARETGGKAYVNQNEIKDGVALAVADNAGSYTIGYYPEDKKWDGKYRTIKVKVNRDGVEVRHRRGYFAIDPTQLKDRKPDQEIAEALGDAIPATMVGFSARVKPTDKGKLGIDFLVDAHTITAADASGGKKLNVSFYAAVFGPDGKMLTNRSMKVDQAFNAENYQQILQHGMLLHMDLDPQPANSRLRLAVRDEPTGYIGTTQVSVAAK